VRRLLPDGVQAWRQVIEYGYEATWKDEASRYEAGRTRRRLKGLYGSRRAVDAQSLQNESV
jgi:hypothetical protein